MDPVIVEQTFDTSKENVWYAITQLDSMKGWFFPEIASFEPKVGFETGFVVQNEDRIFPHVWKLTEVIPFKKITYDWRYEGYPGQALVEFELFPLTDQTKLTLTHTVLEAFPDHIPEFKRESCVEGWQYFIQNSLKDYLSRNY
ncbi:MAG: SRPBCC family protein [Candidatus Cyclobacteriaceae bacterium M3_2C_046]